MNDAPQIQAEVDTWKQRRDKQFMVTVLVDESFGEILARGFKSGTPVVMVALKDEQ